MKEETPVQCSLGRLFLVFTKVGAFTFGGGLSMIPLLEREFVNRWCWLSQEEFTDMLTITNSAPGTFAANSATYIGYRLRGIPGALVSLLGNILVPFAIIVIISAFLLGQEDRSWMDRFFAGLRPAVIALILVAGLRMGQKAFKEAAQWVLGIIALGLVLYGNLDPILLIIAGAAAGIALGLFKNRGGKDAGTKTQIKEEN